MIQKMIAEYLFNPVTKEKILKELNASINIPIIGEKTEAKILDAIWEVIETVLKRVLFQK